MDFKNQQEMHRLSAKTLMTCPLCSQYFDDPRLLPCGHTFCHKCLQKYFDLKQSGSSVRIGRINCPKCKSMIGIPTSGIEGFPVDKKIGRIKDLVINELAENISKKYHSQSQSDTLSSHSDRTDSGDFEETKDDDFPKHSDFTRSRSRFTRSDAASDGSDQTTSNSGSSANSFFPDMSKYAKYFAKDDEKLSSEGYKPHFRPAVRVERHRVGYSSSFQHRRRRIVVGPPKGFDDASDILQQSKYGSAPHIGRENSSNISSSYSDIFGQMPQSSEDLASPRDLGSRISSKYRTTRERRYPGQSTKFPDDDFGEATASMPSLLKTEDEHASGIDPGAEYSPLRNTFSEPKFNSSSSGVGKTNFAPADDSDAYSKRSWKVPEESQRRDSFETSGQPGSSNDKSQGFPHTPFMDRDSTPGYSRDSTPGYSNSSEKPKTSLPTHRENIVTSSTNDGERPSHRVNFREGIRSRSRTTPRPHSDYYSDRPTFTHREMKPEPTANDKSSTTTASSTHSFTPGSPLIGRSRLRKMKEGLYNECKTEEHQVKTPLQRENVHSWYQDSPESKKFDDNFTRLKPEDIKIPQGFQTGEHSSTFHKSASFSTNRWQEKAGHFEDDLRNGNYFMPKLRRKTHRNFNHFSSLDNLNQFDGCIKFELKKGKHSQENLTNHLNDEDRNESEDEHESELKQRNAFNKRILNMRMDRYRYENIMSDFKNGNIYSESNLNDEFIDDMNLPEDNVDGEVVSEPSESLAEIDCAKESKGSSTDAGNSEIKAENTDKSDTIEEKPVPEEVGHNLKEMIESMRAKYQVVDSDDQQSPTLGSAILQPSCCDTVIPKWNFQKTEYAIPTAVAITSKGCTIVADYGNSCLEFFDSDGNYEHTIDGVKPFSIAVNNLDLIIVGDRKGKAVRIFDEFGADVAQWEAGLFGWISGMAVLPNGNVVVHDRDRCKIGIFSSGGEKIKEFASYGVSDSQLCMADFLAVDSKNRIIVADSGNHCLKLFDTDGKFIGKMAGRGTDDGCLEWPKGVCVDSMDNVIVADSQNNRVSMFSAAGHFVQHLITTAPSPYSVCHSRSTKLLGVTHYALTGFSQYDVYQCLH